MKNYFMMALATSCLLLLGTCVFIAFAPDLGPAPMRVIAGAIGVAAGVVGAWVAGMVME